MSRGLPFARRTLTGSVVVRGAVLTAAVLAFSVTKANASVIIYDVDETHYFSDTTPTCFGCGNNAIRIQIIHAPDDPDPSADPDPFLTVTATALTQAQFDAIAGSFAGSKCVPYIGTCIQYTITPEVEVPTELNNIKLTTAWLGSVIDPVLIQREGSGPYSFLLRDQQFFSEGTHGICFGECEADPAITATTDNFSGIIAVTPNAAVPEPGTLVLLGSGLWTAARRRRNLSHF